MPIEVKENSFLLEFDESFKKEKGFTFYDFNKPLELDSTLEGKFDFIFIDPPFITEEVWTKVTIFLNIVFYHSEIFTSSKWTLTSLFN
jgi:16S rRNA G966 N2-methylase RsmD